MNSDSVYSPAHIGSLPSWIQPLLTGCELGVLNSRSHLPRYLVMEMANPRNDLNRLLVPSTSCRYPGVVRFMSLMLSSVEFPYQVPLGEISLWFQRARLGKKRNDSGNLHG